MSRIFDQNAATGRTLATIPTDPSPHEVAVSPNGRLAAVANYGLPFGQSHGSTVTLIDVAAGTKLRTVEVGGGAAPHGLCWLNDERLLCTVEAIEAIVEIDVQAGKVARTIRTAQVGSHMVAASGDRSFTSNVFSGTVSMLDMRQGFWLADRKAGNAPEGIALSPNVKQLWVGNRADHTISVLATADLSVIKTVPVHEGRVRWAQRGITHRLTGGRGEVRRLCVPVRAGAEVGRRAPRATE